MYSRIFSFHNLCLPHPDGGRDDEWVTYSHDDTMVYLLNGDRYEVAHIGDNGIDVDKDINFATETECHAAAAEYYLRNNATYPHLAEWRKAIENEEQSENGVGTVQSQVMEFM